MEARNTPFGSLSNGAKLRPDSKSGKSHQGNHPVRTAV